MAKDGRIDLHLEGDMSSFLSVRYLNNTETGEIAADQETYIDTLLAKYNMTECNPNKVPLKTSVNLDEIAARLPSTPHPEMPVGPTLPHNAVFSWKASLSCVLAMSSAEAELIALCACAADVAYCRKLANELGCAFNLSISAL